MAQPTVISYGNSTFSDVGDAGGVLETVAGVSWQSGDIILVFGGTSNNSNADMLALPVTAGLTGSDLTFSQSTVVNNNSANNGAQVYLWTATATGTGSGSIQSNGIFASNLRGGIAVFVFRGSNGLGTPATLVNSATKTISLTRAQANSHVVEFLVDWNEIGDVTVTTTPTGTVRFAEAEAGQADFFCLSFGDQSATGTTSYGLANHTGTVILSGIVVEVKGTAGGGGPTGTGAINSSKATVAGSAVHGATATGNPTITRPLVAGIGVKGITGTGGLTMPHPAIVNSSSGGTKTGSGALTAGPATTAGLGARGAADVPGAIDLVFAGGYSISGTAIKGSAITGSGSLVSSHATLSGASSKGRTTSATLTGPHSILTGTAFIGRAITGTGALTSSRATASGITSFGHTGTGAITSSTATIQGNGAGTTPGGASGGFSAHIASQQRAVRSAHGRPSTWRR